MLRDQLTRQGETLFRVRSFVPLLLIPIALAALPDAGDLEQTLGKTGETIYIAGCLCLALLGQAIRCLTIGYAAAGTSGRNTRAQRADALNVTGPYSVVRNPLYLANLIILNSLAMATQVWWLPILATLAFALQYERIVLAEEHYLQDKFGESYRAWAARTPAILPRLGLWQRPARSFCPRTAVRREYNGIALILTGLPLIVLGHDLLRKQESMTSWLHDQPHWAALFAIGILVFVVLRTLKKHTPLLRAAR